MGLGESRAMWPFRECFQTQLSTLRKTAAEASPQPLPRSLWFPRLSGRTVWMAASLPHVELCCCVLPFLPPHLSLLTCKMVQLGRSGHGLRGKESRVEAKVLLKSMELKVNRRGKVLVREPWIPPQKGDGWLQDPCFPLDTEVHGTHESRPWSRLGYRR